MSKSLIKVFLWFAAFIAMLVCTIVLFQANYKGWCIVSGIACLGNLAFAWINWIDFGIEQEWDNRNQYED